MAPAIPSQPDVKKIESVQFEILSPEHIRNISVLPIVDKADLSDHRLGPTNKHPKCSTCRGDLLNCPGHFGHLELAKPMFQMKFLKIVLSTMKCVCFYCSKLLADQGSRRFREALETKKPKNRHKQIMKIGKNKCVVCGRQPKLTITGTLIFANFGGQGKQSLTADKVLSVLQKISDADCQRLGFDPKYVRPDWMILQVLPIPPPHVRRTEIINRNFSIENDLTEMLSVIVKLNHLLKERVKDGAEAPISRISQDLQTQITGYIDNESAGHPKVTTMSGRNRMSICCRLKGKEGRIRQNLMGKRVHSSARTVITPDPALKIDEVGVPLSIALDLTYTETVTPLNIRRLKEIVENGPYPPPGKTGAKFIILENGRRYDTRIPATSNVLLEDGVKVARHLQDGDLVILNRQPTLHKMSLMGHRIRIMPCSTFSLNMSVTSPYNADFDGDEMTMHVPQSFETKAEVSELMMVPECIVSPQANQPVIGIVQDTLLGCRKITKRDTFIEKDMFMNMLMLKEDWDGNVPPPAILKPRPLWTGKQVFSVNIPGQINMLSQSAWHSDQETGYITPGDTEVRIESGILLTGTLCKKTLGTSTGSLVHVIWLEVGPDAATKFLANTQWLVNYWLRQHGFTFGVGDIITDPLTSVRFKETISEAKDAVKDLIKEFQDNKLKPYLGKTMTETFENRVNQVLNVARDVAGCIAQHSLAETNNLKAMVTAGSTKGSLINISQMTACVGQQNVEGERIPFDFNRRTLPHFAKDDYGPESRGFVESSYLCGLTPVEFFFHAVGGRDSLIDTAVEVSDTGYMQRRVVKSMEDIMVTYDGTVRNSLGDVIQFHYGEDGMDGVYIESQKLDSLTMKKSEFDRTFKYEIDDENWNPEYLSIEHRDELKTNQAWRAEINSEYQQLVADRRLLGTVTARNGDSTWPLPVNIKRLIWNAQNALRIGSREISGMKPVEIVNDVTSLQKRLVVVDGDDEVLTGAQENATVFFNILLRSTLASKRVLEEYKLSRAAFDWVIKEIEYRFRRSLVTPGEMVGCVAAQSIGEPATQMTLRTVHYAGIGAKNVTVGFPRFQELINVAKTIKTPSMSVYLTPEFSRSAEDAKTVQCALEYTTVKSVTHATELWYDPHPTATKIEADLLWVTAFYQIRHGAVNLNALSPWLLRIELNRELMTEKDLRISDIADKINSNFDDLNCICRADDADSLILRIRSMLPTMKDEDVVRSFKQIESSILTELAVKGIPDINKVHIKEVTERRFDEEDGFKTSKEWMLVTDGVNLLDAMGKAGVDPKRTTSNHLTEIEKVLGIEAARRVLLDEMRAVISFDGGYVNYRHLALLADTMTHRGYLMPITRHGINKSDTGPLMRCSFEESLKILIDAACFAEQDSIRGVSEHIIVGQLAPIGTGICDPYLSMPSFTFPIPCPNPDSTDPPPFPFLTSHNPPTNLAFSPTNLAYSPTTPSYISLSPAYTPDSPCYHFLSPSP